MILRRLLNHVTEQNWFAVAIDLTVVIAGIYLGLQANNWNEMRKESVAEKTTLIALREDLAESKDNLIAFRTSVVIDRNNAHQVLKNLEECMSGDDEVTERALIAYQSIVTPAPRRAAFDEFTASGKYSRLKNRELAQLIHRIYEEYDAFHKLLEFMRRDLSAAGQIIWRYAEYGFDPGPGEDSLMATVNIDLKSHCDSREFKNAIWELVDTREDWRNESNAMILRMDEAIALLDIEMSR